MRRGFFIGAAIGAIALGIIVMWSIFGTEEAFRNEGFALGMTLALIVGFPTSLIVNALAIVFWGDHAFFPVLYLGLAVSVVLNWALIGMLAGWIISLLRRRQSGATEP